MQPSIHGRTSVTGHHGAIHFIVRFLGRLSLRFSVVSLQFVGHRRAFSLWMFGTHFIMGLQSTTSLRGISNDSVDHSFL